MVDAVWTQDEQPVFQAYRQIPPCARDERLSEGLQALAHDDQKLDTHAEWHAEWQAEWQLQALWHAEWQLLCTQAL